MGKVSSDPDPTTALTIPATSPAATMINACSTPAERRVPVVPDAYYLPLGGDRFTATEHTQGPWDPGLQHGGPPSALLAREVARIAC